jgi:hypothetical protein
MTSERQIYFTEYANAGAWRRQDPEHCGCRGSGWFLSDLDTWHKCGEHAPDAEHPEAAEFRAYEAEAAAEFERALLAGEIEHGPEAPPPPLAPENDPNDPAYIPF